MDKQCQFIKEDGTRCGGFSVDESSYCLSHHPDKENTRLERAKKGGSAESYKKLNLKLEPITIKNSSDIMQAVIQVINEVRSGTIPPRIATRIGYLLGIALKAFELSEIDQRV